MSSVTDTLRAWAAEPVVEDRRARAGLGVAAFVLATAFSAQFAVPVPWTAVPMSLQPLFVILAGAMLGPRLGASAMATYVAVGAMGAPVFTFGGAGLPWLLGPTGGYLFAYPAAAFLTGLLAHGEVGWLRTFAGLTLGMLTIYAGGLAQLLVLTGQSFGEVLALAVLPFIVGDAAKILLALVLTRGVQIKGLEQ